MTKRRLLWIGDAGVDTGFARCTHRILETVQQRFEVHVLALGYGGDAVKPQPWPIYMAAAAGDGLGRNRVAEVISRVGPAVVVVQNDPWNIPHYLRSTGNVPVVGIVAVDGLNCRGTQLNGLAHTIFWTEFGQAQARQGGFTGGSSVVGLGVDLGIYRPMVRAHARDRHKLPQALASRGLPPEAFIVGVVGRNQPRKRLDLTLRYFAEWVHEYDVQDAALWVQQAPTGDAAFDLEQLAGYYRISDRLVMPSVRRDGHGVDEDTLASIYNCFDAMASTTQGEGWGLPQLEGMACGVPQLVPDWAALGEWARDAAVLVPCSATAATPAGINVIGGIADQRVFCHELDRLYRDASHRQDLSDAGLRLAAQPAYRWEAVGTAMLSAIEQALYTQPLVAPRQQQQQEQHA